MSPDEILLLSKEVSRASRVKSLRMTAEKKTSHIGSAFSVIDILSVLFTKDHLRKDGNKDHIILSKGHAAAALYAVLDSFGKLTEDLSNFCEPNSSIYGHVNHHASSDIPLSTGSLGHGLPFGLGIAMAKNIRKLTSLTFVILSDGELNEGTTWESALVAGHQNLRNLVVIIDRNRIQSLGFTEETLKLDPIDKKWEAFGWHVLNIDGHHHHEILDAIETTKTKPLCVIANTIKGKGVSFMENTLEWHYKSANSDELQKAIEEIETR